MVSERVIHCRPRANIGTRDGEVVKSRRVILVPWPFVLEPDDVEASQRIHVGSAHVYQHDKEEDAAYTRVSTLEQIFFKMLVHIYFKDVRCTHRTLAGRAWHGLLQCQLHQTPCSG